MALRVTGTANAISGTGFQSGFAGDARGHSVFAWLRRSQSSDTPRAGLAGASATRSNVGLNGSNARAVITDPAAVNLLPSSGTPGAIGAWVPVVHSVRDLAGTRRAAVACRDASGNRLLGVATSGTFALGGQSLNAVAIGMEASGSAFAGDYAGLALWDAALEDAELLALVGGAHPLTVRPGNLAAFFPLESDLRNLANPAFRLTPGASDPIWTDGPPGVSLPPRHSILLLAPRTLPAGGALAGTVAASFGLAGTLTGRGDLTGTMAAGFGLAGTLTAAAAEPVPLRDAVYGALVNWLAAAVADVPVEWDRREEIEAAEDMPRLVLREGGHRVASDLGAGEVQYSLEAELEGYAADATPRQVSAALNRLHARVVAALVGKEIPVGSAGLAAWVVEETMERAVLPAADSAQAVGAFYLSLRVDIAWPVGLGPFTAP